MVLWSFIPLLMRGASITAVSSTISPLTIRSVKASTFNHPNHIESCCRGYDGLHTLMPRPTARVPLDSKKVRNIENYSVSTQTTRDLPGTRVLPWVITLLGGENLEGGRVSYGIRVYGWLYYPCTRNNISNIKPFVSKSNFPVE